MQCGRTIDEVTIAYHTFGALNEERSNAVWIFHALTGNSNPLEWWPGVVGDDCAIDPKKHYIICANMLGSCYGSTEPTSLDFPLLTIRDQVECFKRLKSELRIEKIKVGIGGSMGGQQLLEWAVQEPSLFEYIVPIATNARHSPWGIAFNETQRMAIRNDPKNGLATARAIAMLSYRHYQTYEDTQMDEGSAFSNHKASSYQRYQGEKLQNRFSPFSYYFLSSAMDSHHVGRNDDSIEAALNKIQSKAIVIGIDSDLLFPIAEQKFIAKSIPDADFHQIKSTYGHDAFLIETKQIRKLIEFL